MRGTTLIAYSSHSSITAMTGSIDRTCSKGPIQITVPIDSHQPSTLFKENLFFY